MPDRRCPADRGSAAEGGLACHVGWGIGVIMNAWDVYGRQEITEEDIRREMEHLKK
jgi:hypothetical protein